MFQSPIRGNVRLDAEYKDDSNFELFLFQSPIRGNVRLDNSNAVMITAILAEVSIPNKGERPVGLIASGAGLLLGATSFNPQ